MKEGERRIFVVEKAPSVRNALCALLAGVGCEGNGAHSIREMHERFGEANRDKLVLDLRFAGTLPDPVSPGVKNLEASLVGRILVVTGEVADPKIFRQIEELGLTHFSLKHIFSSLRTFVHALSDHDEHHI
jgi:DNA-binding NtrC family response regulator